MEIGGHLGLGRKRETLAAQGKPLNLREFSDELDVPFKHRVVGSNPTRLIYTPPAAASGGTERR
jgi:hypothetical protein